MKTFLSNNPLQGMPKDKLPTIHNLILLTSQGFASEPKIWKIVEKYISLHQIIQKGLMNQLSPNEILMGFVASCIEDVADKMGIDYTEAYHRMDAVGMISDYIIPFYGPLHSESRECVTASLIDTLKRWEEKK